MRVDVPSSAKDVFFRCQFTSISAHRTSKLFWKAMASETPGGGGTFPQVAGWSAPNDCGLTALLRARILRCN